MNKSLNKILIYRYWQAAIVISVFSFALTYLLTKYFGILGELKLNGLNQIATLVIMLSPLTYLGTSYQKLQDIKEIKGIKVKERKLLRKIVDIRAKDILYTIILALLIALSINGHLLLTSQGIINGIHTDIFIPILVSYIITCIFWIFSAFLAIKEISDFKSLVQQRIDKDQNRERFNKAIAPK